MKLFAIFTVIALSASFCYAADTSASEMVQDIYESCLSKLSFSCIRPKALSWLNDAANQDKIRITNDLSIIRTAEDAPIDPSEQRSEQQFNMIYNIESFLATHSLKVEVPEILRIKEARQFIPESYLNGGLANGLSIPLSETSPSEGRSGSFVKKVMIPFLLGLKFKTSVLVPIALALIAVKTWKAITLGLLSFVLSGALVIFKIAKPKVVNYEVVHYPHHHHHLEHPHVHVEHPHVHVEPHVHHAAWQQPDWSRQFDAQNLAYGQH